MTTEYFSLAGGNFSQNWNDVDVITADDNWSGVPHIVGYRGDNLASSTAVDPRTITASSDVVDVIANPSPDNPSTFATGGVVDFDSIPNPTVAIQGSGTARAPYLVVHLDATGRQNIVFSTLLRDIDTGSTATQPVAIQYRVGDTGPWLNAGYVANANTGGDTPLSVTLPADANNAAQLQVRVITTDAVGSDAFIGIDDISVTSQAFAGGPGTLSIADAGVAEGDADLTDLVFTVSRNGGSAGAVSATYTITFTGDGADADDLAPGAVLTGTVSFGDGDTSATITVAVQGDTDFEPNERFTVTLSAPTGGATLGDAAATGTIANDDDAPAGPALAFINEIHYDNTSTDVGEAIEIAGAAGTNLAGWTLVLYNGNGGGTYGSPIALSGVIGDQDDGYGTLSFPAVGIQNGNPDGVALIDGNGAVVQFLSYGGPMTATNGPAAGMTSTDIGMEFPVPAPGFSLQLTGSGSAYADFTWTAGPVDDSFGQVNAGQNFIGADDDGEVSVRDASVTEGNAGEAQLVFTVQRAGGGNGTASVDYTISFGTANAADLGAGAVLTGTVSFAPGESSKTISVPVAGDTVGEFNETLNVTLSNPQGPIVVIDGAAVGTIVNDDPLTLATYQIQGEGHRSEFVGQAVVTGGIVTAVDSNGFYLQDPTGDGNARTSDAIFVFTGTAPTVAVGDAVTVGGSVAEFLPGNDATNLTVTQLNSTGVTVVSSGNAVPAATVIGVGGLLPPTEIIDDDGLTSYDPATDGLDFYESLEGMLVRIETPLVVSPSNNFGETYVVASGGAGATGVSARGGITISEGDYNPEKIQIDADSDLFAGYAPTHTQGDRLSDVTGVVSYSFNSYEVLVTQAVTVTEDVTLTRETTTLTESPDRLSIATYNLENIDPTDAQEKFDILASNIVFNLRAPDIIAVQEIQDADGAGNGTNLSGTVTANKLIAAITAAGGPTYAYVEVAPATAGSTGGEPGGNIRNGFFYDVSRVSYIAGSAELVNDAVFNGTRRPLAADFVFNGATITAISVHSTSRLGSDPLSGANQPPADAGDAARTNQATAIRNYINDHLATDPSLNFAVMGDFNGFTWENAIQALEAGGVMTDLNRLLPEEERYSYQFDGNLQAIDHILVTGGLLQGAQYDAVHINSEQSGVFRGTDHDPQIATLFLPAAGTYLGTAGADAPRLGAGNDRAYGFDGNDNLLGRAGDDYLDGGASNDKLDGGEGADTMIGGAGNDSYYVDNAGDVVVEGSGGGTDIVNASVTFTLPDEVENLQLTGTAAINATGNALANTIIGNAGDNVINGKGGLDTLVGGAGADRFVIDAPVAGSLAKINDFVSGLDEIAFVGSGFGLAAGPLSADYLVVTTTGSVARDGQHSLATTADHGQFIFDRYHALWWDADGSGAGAAVQVASLSKSGLAIGDLVVL